MKFASSRLLLSVILLLLLSVSALSATVHQLSQIAPIDALLAGMYDGYVPASELLQYGDTGIGTFDKLDGELILIDHKIFQIRSDGKVLQPSLNIKIPFAVAVPFKPTQTLKLTRAMTLTELESFLDKTFSSKSHFYAFIVSGNFSYMKTRSVPAQKKPYRPLIEVTQSQSVFERKSVVGRIVGFWCPDFVKGINVPGYHLHFLSADNAFGGHVLDFIIQDGRVQIDEYTQFFMQLPNDVANSVDFKKDRSQELKAVEQK